MLVWLCYNTVSCHISLPRICDAQHEAFITFMLRLTLPFRAILLAVLLPCFDTVVWASGRASGLYKLSDMVLVWLSVWSEVQTADSLHMVQLMHATTIPKPHHLWPHLNPDWFHLSGTGLPRLSRNGGR